jgi:hypothetical protein
MSIDLRVCLLNYTLKFSTTSILTEGEVPEIKTSPAILNPHSDVVMVKLDIEYTALQQEKPRFVSDMRTRIETYYLIKDGTETPIYERQL